MKTQKNKKMLVSLIAVAAVLITLFAGIGIYNTPENRVNRHLELASRYLEEMDYEQAVIEFDKVIEIDPMSVDAYLGKAEAYVGLKDYDMGVQMLELADQIVEEKSELQEQLIAKFISLADVYISLGDYEKSLEIYDRLLGFDQGNERILAGLEECLRKYVSWLVEQEQYDEIERLSEKYMDKINGVNFQTAIEENILKINEYGATVFEYRTKYKEYEDIEPEEKELINMLIRYVESFDNMETLLVQIRNVEFAEKYNEFYEIYTFFENYKVYFHTDALYKGIEIRPENGTGYCLSYYNVNFEEIKYASCECSDWQWNGVGTEREYHRNDSSIFIIQRNGMMKDSLCTGIWQGQYQGENFEDIWESVYGDKGNILLMDGIEQTASDCSYSLQCGFDLQDEWGREQVYW